MRARSSVVFAGGAAFNIRGTLREIRRARRRVPGDSRKAGETAGAGPGAQRETAPRVPASPPTRNRIIAHRKAENTGDICAKNAEYQAGTEPEERRKVVE